MKTNEELKKDVQHAFTWEPLLKTEAISVTADDGTVTLKGTVDSYPKKKEAENAAKIVAGVKAVIENIDVKYAGSSSASDGSIAENATDVLGGSYSIPKGSVRANVVDGWVTLEGEVPWLYQKFDAKAVVGYVPGVKGVTNNIVVSSDLHDAVEENDIIRALERDWSLELEEVSVSVDGTNVRLSGTVSSLYKREKAQSIAARVPGITTVDNRLIVAPV